MKALLIFAACIGFLLLVASAGTWYVERQTKAAVAEEQKAQQRAIENRRKAVAAKKADLLRQATALIAKNDHESVVELLTPFVNDDTEIASLVGCNSYFGSTVSLGESLPVSLLQSTSIKIQI